MRKVANWDVQWEIHGREDQCGQQIPAKQARTEEKSAGGLRNITLAVIHRFHNCFTYYLAIMRRTRLCLSRVEEDRADATHGWQNG